MWLKLNSNDCEQDNRESTKVPHPMILLRKGSDESLEMNKLQTRDLF